jgi:hypothetical protein
MMNRSNSVSVGMSRFILLPSSLWIGTRKGGRPATTRPAVEWLESRVVPSITLSPLSNWDAGVHFDQRINAAGGIAPYTFEVTDGSLPPGLTLSPAGELSGTPTTPGTFTFTVKATDSGLGSTGSFTTVNYYTSTPPMQFDTSAYGVSVTAGNVVNVVGMYNDKGNVVHGFLYTMGQYSTLDFPSSPNTHVDDTYAQGISGNTIVGWYSVSGVQGGDHGFIYNDLTKTWTRLDVAPNYYTDAEGISATNVVVGYYGQGSTIAYGFEYNGSYTILSDPLATDGTYAEGIYDSNVVGYYKNGSGVHGFRYDGSTYTTLDHPNAASGGSTYAYGITKFAGKLYICGKYEDSSGMHGFIYNGESYFKVDDPDAYPHGATSLRGISGNQIVGTYVVGTYEDSKGHHGFMCQATAATGSRDYTLTINSPVGITTATLPNWTVSQPGYSQVITTSDGTAPYTFSSTGTLPPGLALDTSGALTGTPAAVGDYTFTVIVTDAVGDTANQAYTVTINATLVITTTNLDDGTVGSPYSQTISANGGTSPLTFSETGGSLPAGFALDPATGILSGTTTVAGTSTFVVTATDASGAKGMQSYSLTISPAPADHFHLGAPAMAVWGISFDLVVTALDPYGNVDTNYVGTVTFTSSDSDPGVILPADYAFQPIDSGMHTFMGGAVLVTLGDQTVTATDTVTNIIMGTATITVGPGNDPPPGGRATAHEKRDRFSGGVEMLLAPNAPYAFAGSLSALRPLTLSRDTKTNLELNGINHVFAASTKARDAWLPQWRWYGLHPQEPWADTAEWSIAGC